MVAKVANIADHNPQLKAMEQVFQSQKRAYAAHPFPTADERITLIKRLKTAILQHQDALVAAVNQDFGNRCASETLFAELISLMEAIKYYSKQIPKWMKPERRHVPISLQPAQARVIYQPLGVVGIIVPWNYPYYLALGPALAALAAGNRVMIKMSEYTPHAAEALKKVLSTIYNDDQVAVITGEADVGIAFTKLPFDHILFTGSTSVGRHVMAAAAQNLTPVTLELGGKSPCIVHESFPLLEAAERIAWGKCLNAGQTCVAPDYVFVPRHKMDEFVSTFKSVVSTWYPTVRDNPDFTSVINERQRKRLQHYLDDATAKGARIEPINPANENFDGSGKLPITLVFDTKPDMLIEQDEIFGPLFIIKSYDTLDQALHHINSQPRPLALYYFDFDEARADYVLTHTHSGGVGINDTVSQVIVDDMPFGGVGPSGMGHYHGKEGFLTFSKAKGTFRKGKFNGAKLLFPPWNRRIHQILFKSLLK